VKRTCDQRRGTPRPPTPLTGATTKDFVVWPGERSEIVRGGVDDGGVLETRLDPRQAMVACLDEWRQSIVGCDDAGLQSQVRDVEAVSVAWGWCNQDGSGGDLSLTVEKCNGTPLATLAWPPSEPADEMTARLAILLKSLQEDPGDDVFDASAVLQRLIETLRIGLQRAYEEEELYRRPLIEITNSQWAIATDGLYGIGRPYRIDARSLSTPQGLNSLSICYSVS
jgi:hypothetical protein